MLGLFISTIFLGLTIAIPVGPITLLIMRRTLTSGRSAGMAAGMGAAMADALYAAIAAFGLSSVITILNDYASILRLGGGLFLIWIACGIWRKSMPVPENTKMEPAEHLKSFLGIFFLTLANPLTILGFIGVFSALDPQFLNHGWRGALLLTLGITIGSTLWQNTIAIVTSVLHHALSPKLMLWLNRLSALALLAFAAKAFLETFLG